jgi:DNA-binding transcriptional LysR family regulator
MIPLQRLEGFYWVAKTEGYARAARSFPYPITQPGVHQQVRRLESHLEVELFERVGKDRVILTPAGRLLYKFVAPFFEKLPLVEHAIRTGAEGTLRIQASAHLLRHLLPPWLRRIQSKHSGIDLELIEEKVPDLEALRSGQVDLLVDYVEAIPDDLKAKKLAVARAFIVLASNHPRRGAKSSLLRLEDLASEPFIAYNADRRSRELQLRALELHGIVPRQIHGAESAETILGFVAAGLGFSIVPSILPGGPQEPGIAVQPLTRPSAEFPVYAICRKTAANQSLIAAALVLAPSVEETRRSMHP